MKIVAYALVAVMPVCAAVFAAYLYCTAKRSPEPQLTESKNFFCEYHVYGGMENENLNIIVEKLDDGTVLLTYTEKDAESGEDKIDNRTVPQNIISEILDAYEKYGALKWGELPPSEFEALDAPSKVLKLVTDSTSLTFTGNMEFPSGGGMIFYDICDILLKYKNSSAV